MCFCVRVNIKVNRTFEWHSAIQSSRIWMLNSSFLFLVRIDSTNCRIEQRKQARWRLTTVLFVCLCTVATLAFQVRSWWERQHCGRFDFMHTIFKFHSPSERTKKRLEIISSTLICCSLVSFVCWTHAVVYFPLHSCEHDSKSKSQPRVSLIVADNFYHNRLRLPSKINTVRLRRSDRCDANRSLSLCSWC